MCQWCDQIAETFSGIPLQLSLFWANLLKTKTSVLRTYLTSLCWLIGDIHLCIHQIVAGYLWTKGTQISASRSLHFNSREQIIDDNNTKSEQSGKATWIYYPMIVYNSFNIFLKNPLWLWLYSIFYSIICLLSPHLFLRHTSGKTSILLIFSWKHLVLVAVTAVLYFVISALLVIFFLFLSIGSSAAFPVFELNA